MDTVSVSKGVFIFKNGFKSTKQSKKGRKKAVASVNKNILHNEIWYQSYSSSWEEIDMKIQNFNKDMFSCVLSNLVSFIKSSHLKPVTEIPSATLLTGINMPDHAAQFSTLAKEITHQISPHVAILNAQDCQSIKLLVENMINQLINNIRAYSNEEDDDDDEDEEENDSKKIIKKSQCSFSLLQSWYEDLNYGKTKKVIAIIIPDFESFNRNTLQDFIQIASSYLNILPIVLIFGVATSLSALHKSLPYHVSSKINIQVFNSQPSITYLNNILEHVFFTKDCPFHLGGKLFTLFTDIFLFYDFSVSGFIQNFKYAMIEHYSTGNAKALCCKPKKVKQILDDFDHDDFENVRMLLSFRKYVEAQSWEDKIKLLEDDDYFRDVLEEELANFHQYLNNLHIFLKCLKILVADLPKTPLGKQVRELYIWALSNEIAKTTEFNEAFQLLAFQSKDELTLKIQNMCDLFALEIKSTKFDKNALKSCLVTLQDFLSKLNNDYEMDEEDDDEDGIVETGSEIKLDRRQLKEKLLKLSKQSKPLNKYEKLRKLIVDYLRSLFENNLLHPKQFVFHEIFFFNDISIQNNIIGSHRAAIHTALNDPIIYLQCGCCEIPNDAAILSTMPDICIAYKLHLEYGKMINLYDWLQAFLSILDPICAEDEDEKREVNPQLQARFTQSVAELEFLGFIKSSKRKTDHVSRLTWGG